MFIQNKYYYQYLGIVLNALNENRERIPYEHEEHHIMPKAIWPEYKTEDWNLVLLTHKEHYVCHHLLTKCLPHADTTRAYWFMTHNKGMPITSKVYENLRRKFAQMVSDTHKDKVVSEETRQKLSKINTGKGDCLTDKGRQAIIEAGKKRTGANNPMWQKEITDEHRQNLIASRTGKKHFAVNGYYITPWGKFLTAGEAAEASEYDLNLTSLRRWCKDNCDKPIRRQSYLQCRYLNDLGEEVVGKTFREIGFYYEPF